MNVVVTGLVFSSNQAKVWMIRNEPILMDRVKMDSISLDECLIYCLVMTTNGNWGRRRATLQ